MQPALDGQAFPIRPDLREAHERAWKAIASPGTWLDGARRVAVVREVRNARDCEQCARAKKALSPETPGVAHQSCGELSLAEVELIHRVVSDPGRLSQRWTASLIARGLSEGEYVEISGLIAMAMMLDTCARGLGLDEQPLPDSQAGAPSRYRPPGAKLAAAWLPLVEPEDAVESDGAMYPHNKVGYIYRALSLVPQAVRDYWALANAHYMPGQYVYKFDTSIRAISRPQVEILASRVSALHQCVY